MLSLKRFSKIVLVVISIFLCFSLVGCNNSLKAKNTQKVSGANINIENVEIVITALEERELVAPEKPEGYYDYYEKHDGYEYDVLKGTIVNNSQVTLNTKNIKVKMSAGKKEYDGTFVVQNEAKSEFVQELKPGEKGDCFIISIRKTNDTINNKAFIYYNTGLTAGDGKTFDYKIEYTMS